MLQSWLRVLQWWWTGDHSVLEPLAGTALEFATHVAMQPPPRGAADPEATGHPQEMDPHCQPPSGSKGCPVKDCDHDPKVDGQHKHPAAFVGGVSTEQAKAGAEKFGYAITPAGKGVLQNPFLQHVFATHEEKHAAYGDSWKRRGEMLGIMANIARKVDRLGGSETSDETSADTAMDLMVYLAKYAAWLFDERNGTDWSSGTEWPNNRIADTAARVRLKVEDRSALEDRLREQFDDLEHRVVDRTGDVPRAVDTMLSHAYVLARHLWDQEQDDYRGADVD
jgi:hypothetical protein